MQAKEYNGWYNYETWLVNLWLNNEQWFHTECSRMARRATSNYDAGEAIKAWLEDRLEEQGRPTTGLLADLVTSALSEVNFTEIGKAYREDVDAQSDDDDEEE